MQSHEPPVQEVLFGVLIFHCQVLLHCSLPTNCYFEILLQVKAKKPRGNQHFVWTFAINWSKISGNAEHQAAALCNIECCHSFLPFQWKLFLLKILTETLLKFSCYLRCSLNTFISRKKRIVDSVVYVFCVFVYIWHHVQSAGENASCVQPKWSKPRVCAA